MSTSATLFFVNQTSYTIKWTGNPSDFFTDISAGDTLIYKEKYEEYFGCPTVDNYGPLGRDQVVPIYGDTGKCELGLLRIENYENRQEVELLVLLLILRNW